MLEYRNITKKFGNKEAVKELTLKLKKGTIYGLLGENGSGKTTLMKMAAGLTQPTEGEILFEGHPLSYQDKASIAYMSTEPFFYSYMKVKDVEEYYADYSPKRYKRTYSLKRSIKPYTKTISSGEFLELEVGIEYDPSRLEGVYESNSYYHQDGDSWISRYNDNFDNSGISNGIPESDWILNNFLEGLHPITTVNKTTSKNGKITRKYTYSPYQGSTHPLKLMQEFVDREIESKVHEYVQEELWNVISDYF